MAKKQSFLGVDIGSAGIKVVELMVEKKRPKLVTYGFSNNSVDSIKTDFTQFTADAAKILQKICEESGTVSSQVVASLPTFEVYSSIITLPQMPKKELKEAVAIEAKKIIPHPPEETIIDWRIIKEEIRDVPIAALGGLSNEYAIGSESLAKKIVTKKQPFVKILLTGTSKKLVARFMEVFKAANLNLLSLETEDFALIRSLIGNDKSTIMLVDLGATTCSIIVVRGGLPVMQRSLQHGGLLVSKYLAQKMNIPLSQAEQFKQDYSALQNQNDFAASLQISLNPVINGIKYVFNLFQQQNPGVKIEKIILTGGSSMLPNLSQFLSDIVKVKVYLGDPWARVMYPEELKPILDVVGPRLSIAVGLAMREME